jgi:alkylhydroperoxidase family enzyme
LQGGTDGVVEALRRGDLDGAVEPAERALLELARVLTLTPARTADEDVERARSAGWTEAQIAEAVYVIALFAFFNRVADAFGLPDPDYGSFLPQKPSGGESPLPERAGGR